MSDTASFVSPDARDNGKGTDTHRCSSERICCGVAVAVSMCFNVIIVVMIVLGSPTVQNTQTMPSAQSAEQAIDGSTVCSDCRNFHLPTDQLQINIHLYVFQRENGNVCCLRHAEGIWRLLSLMDVKSMMQQKQSLGRREVLPSSAHLYLDRDHTWTDAYGYGAAHVTTSIKMADGRLQVTEAGYYNIYSFITLKTRSELLSNIKVNHSIIRINRLSIPHTDVILYKSVEMSRTSETFANSYLDGVVKFNANDELYVHVSNTSAIYQYPPSNFFGLHLVRSL